jgi:hypothetical protein
VTGVFKHSVAVFSKVGHVVSNSKISQPQGFWNVNGFWTREARIALATAVSTQGILGLSFQTF